MNLKNIWASILNNRAKNGSDKILKSLQIKQGDVIADIGSGGGYYSFLFSELIEPEGKVYAIDTDKALLECLDKKVKKQRISNIATLDGGSICNLPKKSCDLIFLRNVFHHILNPTLYFQNLRESMNPEGRIAIIEWSPNGMMRNRHCTDEKVIIKVLQDAGYKQMESYEFLKGQSFNIFKIKQVSGTIIKLKTRTYV